MNSMTERVIVVVPTHNGVDETLELLQSIAGSETPDLEIIVVDDGSTDDTTTQISVKYPDVTVISASGDLWWAETTNIGIREALKRGATHILTMNNDNIVDRCFLRPLLEALRSSPFSIVTSKLLSVTDHGYVCSFGGAIDWLKGEIRDRTSRRDNLDFSMQTQAEWIHASSTLYPATIFNELGLFDNIHYPQYHGDADFSLRAVKLGYSLLVEPRSVVYRRIESSGGVTLLKYGSFLANITSIRSLFYFRSNYSFYKTHCKIGPFYLFLFVRYVRLFYSWLYRKLVRFLTQVEK